MSYNFSIDKRGEQSSDVRDYFEINQSKDLRLSIKQLNTSELALHCISKIGNKQEKTCLKRAGESFGSNEKHNVKYLKIDCNKESFFSLIKKAFFLRIKLFKNFTTPPQYIPNIVELFLNSQDEQELLNYCKNVFLDCDVVTSEILDLLLFLFTLPKVMKKERISYEYYSVLKEIIECLVKLSLDEIFLSLMDCGISLDEIKVESLSLLLLAYNNKQYKVAATILENNKHRALELLGELVYSCDILTNILPFLDEFFINLILESLVKKSFINLDKDSNGVYDVNSRCGIGETFTDNSPATPLEQALRVEESSLFNLILALGASDLSSIKNCSIVHYSLFLNDFKAILRSLKHFPLELPVDGFDLAEYLINHGSWMSIFVLHVLGYKMEDKVVEECLSLIDKEDCLEMLLQLFDNKEFLKRVCKYDIANLIKRDEFQEEILTYKVIMLLAVYDDEADKDKILQSADSIQESFDYQEEIFDNNDFMEFSESSINDEELLLNLQHLINKSLSNSDEYYSKKQTLASLSVREIIDNINQSVNDLDVEGCLELYKSCLKDNNVITEEINKLFELALDYLILTSDKEVIEKLETLTRLAFDSCKLAETIILVKIYKSKTGLLLRINTKEFLKIINNIQKTYEVRIAFIQAVLKIEDFEYYTEDQCSSLELLEGGFYSFILELIKYKKFTFLKVFLQNTNALLSIEPYLISAFLFTIKNEDFISAAFILEHVNESVDLLSFLDVEKKQISILKSIADNCNGSRICINKIILDLVRRGCVDLECNESGEYDINSRCGTLIKLNHSYFTPLEQALLIDESGLFDLLIALKASHSSSIIGYNILHFTFLLNNKQVILKGLKRCPELIKDLSDDIMEELFHSESWISIVAVHILGVGFEETVLEIACCLVDEEDLLDFLIRLSNNSVVMTDDLKSKVLHILQNTQLKQVLIDKDLQFIESLYSNLVSSSSVELLQEKSLEHVESLDLKLMFDNDILSFMKVKISKVIQEIVEQGVGFQTDLLQALLSLQDLFNNNSDYLEIFKQIELYLLKEQDTSLDIIELMSEILGIVISDNSKEELSCLELFIFRMVEQCKIVELKKLSKLLFNKMKKPLPLSKNCLIGLLKNQKIVLKDKMLFLEALVDFIKIDEVVIILDSSELLDSIPNKGNTPSVFEEVLLVFLLLQNEFDMAQHISNSLPEERSHICFQFFIDFLGSSADVIRDNRGETVFVNNITTDNQTESPVEIQLEAARVLLEEEQKEKPPMLRLIQIEGDDCCIVDITSVEAFYSLLEQVVINKNEASLKLLLELGESSNNVKLTGFHLMKIVLNTDDIDSILFYLSLSLPIKDLLDEDVSTFVNSCIQEQKWISIFVMKLLEFNISLEVFEESKSRIGIYIILNILYKFSLIKSLFTQQIKSFIFSCLFIEEFWKQNQEEVLPEALNLMSLFEESEEFYIDCSYGKRLTQTIEKRKEQQLCMKAILNSDFEVFLKILCKVDLSDQKELFYSFGCIDKIVVVDFFNKIFLESKKYLIKPLMLETLKAFGFVKRKEEYQQPPFFILDYSATKQAYELMTSFTPLIELFVNLQDKKQKENSFIFFVKTRNFKFALVLLKCINFRTQYNSLKLLQDVNEQDVIDFFVTALETKKTIFTKSSILNYMSARAWIKIKSEGYSHDCLDDIHCNYNVIVIVSTLAFSLRKQSLMQILFDLNIQPLTSELYDIENKEYLFVMKVKNLEFLKASNMLRYFSVKEKETILELLKDIPDEHVVDFLIFDINARQNNFSKTALIKCMLNRGWIQKQELLPEYYEENIYFEEQIVLLHTTIAFKLKNQSLIKILYYLSINKLKGQGIYNVKREYLFVNLIRTKKFEEALVLLKKEKLNRQMYLLTLLDSLNDLDVIEFLNVSLTIKGLSLCKRVVLSCMSSCGWIKIKKMKCVYENLDDIHFSDNVVLIVSSTAYRLHKELLISILSDINVNELNKSPLNILWKEEAFEKFVRKGNFSKACKMLKYFSNKQKANIFEILKEITDVVLIDFLSFAIVEIERVFSSGLILTCMLDRKWIERKTSFFQFKSEDISFKGGFVLLSKTEIFKLKKQSLIDILLHLKLLPLYR